MDYPITIYVTAYCWSIEVQSMLHQSRGDPLAGRDVLGGRQKVWAPVQRPDAWGVQVGVKDNCWQWEMMNHGQKHS